MEGVIGQSLAGNKLRYQPSYILRIIKHPGGVERPYNAEQLKIPVRGLLFSFIGY